MLPSLQPPTREVDVDFLVFVERYATDLLKWDILTFFANNPDLRATASTIAQRIGRMTHSVRPELGDLVLLGILDQIRMSDDQIFYQLTKQPSPRNIILKFAEQLISRPPV